MRRHGDHPRRTLEKLLTAADSSLAAFEALPHATARVSISLRRGGVPPSPITIRQTTQVGKGLMAIGSDTGQVVARPSSLAAYAGAFAMTVVEDSM